MKLWQGHVYKDDRLFILDLQKARKGQRTVWAVTTRRNIEGFPPFRVDDFASKDEAVAFIERIEPETPRISLGGRSPDRPLVYAKYLATLKSEGLPSAMEIYELNKTRHRDLIIDEISEDELRNI